MAMRLNNASQPPGGNILLRPTVAAARVALDAIYPSFDCTRHLGVDAAGCNYDHARMERINTLGSITLKGIDEYMQGIERQLADLPLDSEKCMYWRLSKSPKLLVENLSTDDYYQALASSSFHHQEEDIKSSSSTSTSTSSSSSSEAAKDKKPDAKPSADHFYECVTFADKRNVEKERSATKFERRKRYDAEKQFFGSTWHEDKLKTRDKSRDKARQEKNARNGI